MNPITIGIGTIITIISIITFLALRKKGEEGFISEESLREAILREGRIPRI